LIVVLIFLFYWDYRFAAWLVLIRDVYYNETNCFWCRSFVYLIELNWTSWCSISLLFFSINAMTSNLRSLRYKNAHHNHRLLFIFIVFFYPWHNSRW
jgi:hypothetical protein